MTLETIKKSSRLIVKNLPYSLDEKTLKEKFEEFGTVTDCRIIFKGEKNRRFAFIGFLEVEQATKAKKTLNNTLIENCKLQIEYSALKKQEAQKKPEELKKFSEKRLFLKNLPFQIGEEEIENFFKKYGNLTELKLLKNSEQKSRGICFLSFEDSNAAIKIINDCDNKTIFGRILHVSFAEEQIKTNFKEIEKEKQIEQQKSSFKKIQKTKLFSKMDDTANWNSSFMNPNTILERMAQKLNLSKKDMLSQDIENPAALQTIVENEIIQEVKEFFAKYNMNWKSFEESPKNTQRSNTVIILKNIPFTTQIEKLRKIFERWGKIETFLISENKAIGVVQFNNFEYAKNAFESLQGFLYQKIPLFLEWAPETLLKQQTNEFLKKVNPEEVEEVKQIFSKTVFIKNLNYETQEEHLEIYFQEQQIKGVKSTTIIKKNGQSNGYGFVEFDSSENALDMIKKLQNVIFQKHLLQLSLSRPKIQENKQVQIEDQKNSQKLILRNIAFQATKKELNDLLQNLIQYKSLRLPKKLDGSPKGFAFLEFNTIEECEEAFQQLSQLHFYGRKIAIEYANT